MRVAIVIDKENWAFHMIAKKLLEHGVDGQIIIGHKIDRNEALHALLNFDVVHFLDWHFISRWKYEVKNSVISIHSHRNRDGIDWAKDHATRITVVNPDMLREFPGSQYIPNGLEHEKFFQRKPKVLGFAGAPDIYKGFPMVQEICKGLNITLRSAQKEGYTYERMPDFYSEVDAIICPSVNEGFNMPLVEALACGKTVFTTEVGIASELKHAPQLVLIRRERQDITRKLEAFFTPQEMLRQFNWKTVTDAYKAKYEEVYKLFTQKQ